ncbi:MarR family winged helix-turn-helix transcriptional regulator [Novosphingobium sp. KN65.2]|uniref:MarR family winged helix-turn-helix transcriptional regulator n=1 Tax=Novosphingobium sp. KN65.2 TaxID=1478134 RepID=UPI0005E24AD7|nr:MarR family transcriptional regulator [Novosphingobium sp. KN65.2]CDO36606.1 putative transcriptional regulatory protein, MarR family [Novosphingobium sp. KN65.2]
MLIDHMKAMPGHLVRRVQQISTAIFAEELAAFDLTAVQLAALVAVAETPDMDATRLAELICFDRATIGDVIARLERKGLIARSQGVRDKRTKLLSTTPAAAPLIAACMKRVEAVQVRLLAGLSAEERSTFQSLLTKVVVHADSLDTTKHDI